MRTKNQELMNSIISLVDSEYDKNRRVPTIREIGSKLQISKSSVGDYLNAMAKKGLIKLNSGSRGIVTNKMQKSKLDVAQIPIVGSIACGTPLFAEENIESYIPISKEFLGNGNYFILKASGNSMVNAGICNGDYVIVKQQETAEEGQIIVALIDDEATLKRYYLDKANKKIRLHPENNKMKDMFFDSIVIQGVAVKVIKDLV